jgi:hypothetical protein
VTNRWLQNTNARPGLEPTHVNSTYHQPNRLAGNLGRAFAGWAARQRLAAHHLSDETKNLVSVSMAVVATLSALVLDY